MSALPMNQFPTRIPPEVEQILRTHAPMPVAQQPQAQTQQQVPIDRGSILKQFLLRMGVPLAATIAGTVSDSALPGAAGLATGYNTGYNRQEDMANEDQDFIKEEEYKTQKDREMEDYKSDKRTQAAKEIIDYKAQQPKQLSSKEREVQRKIKSAKNLIGTLKQQLNKIPASESGAAARLSGVGRNLKAKAGYDTDVYTYNNLRKGILSQLAKIVGGESGVLTNQDIARMEAAVPRVTDTKQEREMAFDMLEGILQESSDSFEGSITNTQDYVPDEDITNLTDEELRAILAE